MVNGLRDGKLVIDGEGFIRMANSAAATLLGRAEESLLGVNVIALINECSQRVLMERSGTCSACWLHASLTPFQCHAQWKHGDGTTLPIQIVINRYSNGGQPEYLAILQEASGKRPVRTRPAGAFDVFAGLGKPIASNEDDAPGEGESHLAKGVFAHIFASAAIGMVICDPGGRFLMANPAACGILGRGEDELLNMSLPQVCHAEAADRCRRLIWYLVTSEHDSCNDELCFTRKSGESIWGIVALALLRSQDGAPLYLVGQIIDDTARKQACEALRTGEARLSHAHRMAQLGQWEWDMMTNGLQCSDEFFRIFGIRRAQFHGRMDDLIDRVHPDDRAAVLAEIGTAAAQLRTYSIDHRILLPDGSIRVVHEQGEPVGMSAGQPQRMIGTVQDITERKSIEQALIDSQQKLRDLAAHHEIVREDERRRITREVHEELGQLLTALKMDVSLLQMNLGDRPEALVKLAEMRKLVEMTIAMVRNVVTELRPAALNLGLVPAIEWLMEQFSQRTGIACRFEKCRYHGGFDDATTTAVFRIVQECLANVACHAKATEAAITLEDEDDRLVLSISDDGHGFDPDAVSGKRTFGLLGMRERALMLGGEFRIESAPGQGTTLRIEIPSRGADEK